MLPPYFQLGIEKSVDRGFQSEPPVDYFEAAVELSSKGIQTVIVSYVWEWYLLREPTWKELKTYLRMMNYKTEHPSMLKQPAGALYGKPPIDHSRQVRQAAVKWLLETCVVYPVDFSEKQYPFNPGVVPQLLRHLLKYANMGPDEIRKVTGRARPQHYLNHMERVIKTYGIPIDIDSMSVREVYEMSSSLDEIIDLKDKLSAGQKIVTAPTKPQGKKKGPFDEDAKARVMAGVEARMARKGL